ncbi:MAG: XRE family transcriptional regulator [Bacteroidales bacterium]|nr:XRE family transcriptional regulator [Bacteroidales bacterium]
MHSHNKVQDTGFHIGQHIKEVVVQKGVKVPWLAQQLGCHRNNVYLIFSRPWIDSGTLMKLSCILGYDFFAVLSAWHKKANLTLTEPYDATLTSPSRS